MLRGVDEQWDRLASEVKRRMADLRLTIPGLCSATGLSDTIIRSVVNASKTSYRADTGYKITQALGWTSGSWDAVLAGGDPALDVTALDAQMAALREKMRSEADPNIAADGVDMAELLQVDPEAYRKVVDEMRWHLARAKQRRSEG